MFNPRLNPGGIDLLIDNHEDNLSKILRNMRRYFNLAILLFIRYKAKKLRGLGGEGGEFTRVP
jgi:hypothetical protein